MYSVNVNFLILGPRVRPRILRCLTVGTSLLLMVRLTPVLYSEVEGVNRVAVDLSAFSWRSFLVVQV